MPLMPTLLTRRRDAVDRRPMLLMLRLMMRAIRLMLPPPDAMRRATPISPD